MCEAAETNREVQLWLNKINDQQSFTITDTALLQATQVNTKVKWGNERQGVAEYFLYNSNVGLQAAKQDIFIPEDWLNKVLY